MELTFNLVPTDYTYICVLGLLALALNFGYSAIKGKENLMELAVATLVAEVFVLGMWLAVMSLNNL